jgi:hypothetical protein
MPVSAGVIRNAFKSAMAALLHMAAECLGPADLDMAHYLELGTRQAILPSEAFTVKTEYIRDFILFHRRPPSSEPDNPEGF